MLRLLAHPCAPGPLRGLLVHGWAGLGTGRVCFLDDTGRQRAGERFVPAQAEPAVWRRLPDGSEHRVVKVYYSPAELAARLAELGWSAEVGQTGTPLLVGTAQRIGDL